MVLNWVTNMCGPAQPYGSLSPGILRCLPSALVHAACTISSQFGSAVSLGKLGSWFLLLIISYALDAIVNRPQPIEQKRADPYARDPVNI